MHRQEVSLLAAAPQIVLQKGKLNPRNLQLFRATDYPALLKHIKVR